MPDVLDELQTIRLKRGSSGDVLDELQDQQSVPASSGDVLDELAAKTATQPAPATQPPTQSAAPGQPSPNYATTGPDYPTTPIYTPPDLGPVQDTSGIEAQNQQMRQAMVAPQGPATPPTIAPSFAPAQQGMYSIGQMTPTPGPLPDGSRDPLQQAAALPPQASIDMAPPPASGLGNFGAAAFSSWADPLAKLSIRALGKIGLLSPDGVQAALNDPAALPFDPNRWSGALGAGAGQGAILMGSGGIAGGGILGATAVENATEGIEARAKTGQTASLAGQLTDVVGHGIINYLLGRLPGVAKLFGQTGGALATQAAKPIVESMMPEVAQMALQISKRVLAAAGTGAAGMSAAQLAGNALDKYTGVQSDKQLTEGVGTAALQGAAGGLIFQGMEELPAVMGRLAEAWKDRPLTAQVKGIMDTYGVDPQYRGGLLRLLRAKNLAESGEAANPAEAMAQAGVTPEDLRLGKNLQQFVNSNPPSAQQSGEAGPTPASPSRADFVANDPAVQSALEKLANVKAEENAKPGGLQPGNARYNNATKALATVQRIVGNRYDRQFPAPQQTRSGPTPTDTPAPGPEGASSPSSTPAEGSQVPVIEVPGQTPANDQPPVTAQTTSPPSVPPSRNPVNRPSRPFTKTWLAQQIQQHFDEQSGLADQQTEDEKAAEQSGGAATTFQPVNTPSGYPDEVRNHFTEGDWRQLTTRGIVSLADANQSLTGATWTGGEDAMHAMGHDEYIDMLKRRLENSQTGRLRQAVEYAKNSSQDPTIQLYAAIHDLMHGQRKAVQSLDPSTLHLGEEFEVMGRTVRVIDDENGELILKDGDELPTVPVQYLSGKIPIDRGTRREGGEPALPEGDFTDGLADMPAKLPALPYVKLRELMVRKGIDVSGVQSKLLRHLNANASDQGLTSSELLSYFRGSTKQSPGINSDFASALDSLKRSGAIEYSWAPDGNVVYNLAGRPRRRGPITDPAYFDQKEAAVTPPGQSGLFGQDVPDRSKLTGSQQSMFPQDWGKAPIPGAKGVQTPPADQAMAKQYPASGTPAIPGLEGAISPAQNRGNNVQSPDVVGHGHQSLESQPGGGQAVAGGGAAGPVGRGVERAGADALGQPGAGTATPAGRTAGPGTAAGDGSALPRRAAGAGQAGGGAGAIEPGGGGQDAAGQAGRTVPSQRGVNEPQLYSKPELEELPFAQLKKLVEQHGMAAKPIGEGGLRQKMINGILEAQGERTPEKAPWEDGLPETTKGDGTAAAAPGPNDPLPKVPLMSRLRMFRAKPETMSRQDLSNFVRDKLGVAIAQGVNRRRALGFYRFAGAGRIIRLKRLNELGVLAHELGHHIDYLVTGYANRPVIGKKDAGAQVRAYYDAIDGELLKLGAPTSRSSYTVKQKRMEGSAEFLRYWLMNPFEAQLRAPTYFQAFESQMLQHSRLWDPLKQLQSMYQAYLAQDGPTRLRAQVAYDDPSPTARSPNDHGFRGLYVALADDLAPLDWLRRDLEGPDPLDPTDKTPKASKLPHMVSQDAYSLARLNKGNRAMVLDWVKHGILDTHGNMIQRGLEPILKDAGATTPAKQRDLQDYMIAQRALELYGQVREGKRELRNVHDEFGGPLGITEQDARDTMKKFDSPEFQKAADEIRAWEREAGPRYAVKTGYYSQKDAAALEAMNQYHVPLHRVMDLVQQQGTGTAGKLVDRPKLFHRIMGSGRRILPPFQTMIRNTMRLVENVEANRAAVAAFKMLKESDRGGVYADPVAKPLEMQGGTLEEIKSSLIAAGVPKDLLESHGDEPPAIDLDTAFRLFRPTAHNPAKQEAAIREDGKINVWQVHDPVIYHALTGDFRAPTTNALIRLLVLGKQTLRTGVTAPLGFALTAAERHQFMAPLLSRYGSRIYKGDMFRGMFHIVTNSDAYHQWLQARGADSNEVGWYTNKFERQIGRLAKSPLQRITNATVNPAAWLHGLESISELFMNAPRVGEFLRGIHQEGVNEEGLMRAGLASRNIGIDYSRGGDWARKTGQYAAFFNAGIQAKDAMARAFKDDPVGSTIKALLGVTLMSLALHWLSRDNPHYQERKRERDHYWLIPLGNANTTDKFFRVMKPWELGQVFGSWAEDIVDAMHEHDPAALKQILPDRDTAMDVVLDTVPNVLRPLMENEAGTGGYDYHFKKPIVPEHELKLEPPMQYGHYTSETAKQLGKLMNVSPRKIDHIIYGYTGSLGADATAALDKIVMRPLAGAEGEVLPSQDFPADAPGLSRFFGRDLEASSADSILRVYDRLHEVDQAKATLMAKEKQGSASADAYAKDHADVLADVDRSQAVRQQLTGLRGAIDAVFEDKKMTPQEKQQQLRDLNIQMINVARAFLGKSQMADQPTAGTTTAH